MSLSEPRRLLKTGEEKVQHHFFLVSDHAQLEISVVYGIERLTEIRDAGDPAAHGRFLPACRGTAPGAELIEGASGAVVSQHDFWILAMAR